jgi:hypothetical protein
MSKVSIKGGQKKRKTKKRGYRGKSPRKSPRKSHKKNKAGSLKKTKKTRFISRRRTSKSRDRSLDRKYMSKLKKQTKKSRTQKKREKAFEFKTHLLPASESATGSPIETLIKWCGHRNKMGKKMYSIYDSHLLNIDPTDKSALIDGLYYVKGKNNKKGTYTWAEPRIDTRNIKSRSKSKSPKRLGFTIR